MKGFLHSETASAFEPLLHSLGWQRESLIHAETNQTFRAQKNDCIFLNCGPSELRLQFVHGNQ